MSQPSSAGNDPLFQPFKLKHMLLKNRIMSTSHTCRLPIDGMPKDRGTVSADEVYQSLRGVSCNDGVTDIDALMSGKPQPWVRAAGGGPELHRIGDAVSSRNIHTAILDALRLCAAL